MCQFSHRSCVHHTNRNDEHECPSYGGSSTTSRDRHGDDELLLCIVVNDEPPTARTHLIIFLSWLIRVVLWCEKTQGHCGRVAKAIDC